MDAARKYLPKSRTEGNYVLLLKDPLLDYNNAKSPPRDPYPDIIY